VGLFIGGQKASGSAPLADKAVMMIESIQASLIGDHDKAGAPVETQRDITLASHIQAAVGVEIETGRVSGRHVQQRPAGRMREVLEKGRAAP
jgi:hypothetical protein